MVLVWNLIGREFTKEEQNPRNLEQLETLNWKPLVSTLRVSVHIRSQLEDAIDF